MKKVLIIAEAGVNHNADMNMAKKMIDVAKSCGADVVKFQTAVPELVMTDNAQKADYQVSNTGIANETQLEMARKIHLPLSAYEELQEYCKSVDIHFLSTPFDHTSIDLLNGLGMEIFKIPSGEITNLPYLRKIGGLGKKVILSTGMANLGEIESALNILFESGMHPQDITVLHCHTDYPTKMEDVNLSAMVTLAEAFKINVGYSDHTLGVEVPVAAVALGASVIEKHFTLDKTLPGPDHQASLEPDELKLMVDSIRNIESAMGNGVKSPSPSESKNIVIARRSIHLSRDFGVEETISEEGIIMKRPGDGISPMLMNLVVGRKLKHALPKDHKLTWGDLEYQEGT